MWKTSGVLGDVVTNLSGLVHANAVQRADAEALVQPLPQRRALSWAELDARLDEVAAGLADRGLRAGHRIGLSGANSIEFVVCYLAALRAGLVAVPLDPHPGATPPEARAAELGTKLLLGGADEPLTAASVAALSRAGTAVVSPPDAEALAVLLRTAGSTTGEPRWAMLTHRALLAPVRAPGPETPPADATILGVLPLFHVFGLGTVLGGWLGGGSKLVLAEPAVEQLPGLVEAEGVDHLPLTPSLVLRLLRSGLGSTGLDGLRTVLVAGAQLPDWLAEEFAGRTGLRIERGYGLTEAAAVSATFGGPVLGPSHVGRRLPGVEIRVGDGGDPAEPGLLALRGANLFSGYWPDGAGGPDAEGWFVTDDIGYFRGDELFLVDRSRDRIFVHGFSVFPAEIEQVLREVPAVTGAAAVGIPDDEHGTRIVAYVSGDVSVAELQEHCRRLAPYKRPAEIHVTDDLPHDVKGEVHRTELRDRHRVRSGPA